VSERLERLRRDELTDPAALEMWDAITAGRGARVVDEHGRMTGPFNLWLRMPVPGRHLLAIGGSLRDDTTLDRGLAELAICTVSAHWRVNFAFDAHARMARDAGVSDAILDALVAGEEPPLEGEEQAVAHAVALALVRSSTLDDDLFARAVATLGEVQLLELVVICGWYSLGAYAMNAFEVPMSAGVDPPWAVAGSH
jgi:4-carboxymuconolactone decarboxylase